MTYVSVFLVLCASGIMPLISYPSNHFLAILPQLSRLNYHTSAVIPLRSSLDDSDAPITSGLSCRKFNVEQQENMTLSRKFNLDLKNMSLTRRFIFVYQPTFQENMEVNRTDWYREDEWKF